MLIYDNSQRNQTREDFLKLIGYLYKNPTANILLNGENPNPLKTGQGKDVSSHYYYSTQNVLLTAVRQEKDIKGICIIKEEIKLFLFADDMVVYMENPKEYKKNPKGTNPKFLELISELFKIRVYESTTINCISIYQQ